MPMPPHADFSLAAIAPLRAAAGLRCITIARHADTLLGFIAACRDATFSAVMLPHARCYASLAITLYMLPMRAADMPLLAIITPMRMPRVDVC